MLGRPGVLQTGHLELLSGPHTEYFIAIPRSHRNEGDEPVELWAVSRRLDHEDAVKIDDLWEASSDAVQERAAGS